VNYFLERTTNLASPFVPLAANIVGQAGTTSYTNAHTTGAGPFFYRVGVQAPWEIVGRMSSPSLGQPRRAARPDAGLAGCRSHCRHGAGGRRPWLAPYSAGAFPMLRKGWR
jgi:hypothetical protein